jgi:hypothetical protein
MVDNFFTFTKGDYQFIAVFIDIIWRTPSDYMYWHLCSDDLYSAEDPV